MSDLGLHDWLILAGAGVFGLVGVLLMFNVIGTADRAARGGAESKRGYTRGEQLINPDVLMSPTTRSGARRIGIALVVVALLAIAATLAGS